jgi:hypothetical protein
MKGCAFRGVMAFLSAVSTTASAAPATTPPAGSAEPGKEDRPTWSPGERTTSALPGEMHGDEGPVTADGAYGRFGGRFDLAAAAGAEIREGGLAGAVYGSVHYFSMAGVYAEYSDAFDADRRTARHVSFGVDLRPAFVPRWSKDMESGPGFLDLAIDSISLGLGAYFREPRGQSLGDARGLELSLGFGIPLAGKQPGPWLRGRGVLRWDEPTGHAATAGLVTLGWDFVL